MAENKCQGILHPLFVVLIFLLFTLLYALFVPVWEAPDEPAHYIRIRKLAEPGFALPDYPGPIKTIWSEGVLYSDYQGAQPPLYYWVATGVLKGLERVTEAPAPEFLFPPVRSDFRERTNLFLHPPLRLRQHLNALAPVYGLRLFSVLLGAGAVFLIYRIGRAVYPSDPALALLAGGVAATLPQFNFISGAVGNDPAAALLGAGTLLYLVRGLVTGRPVTARYYLGLGGLLSLGLLVKFNLVFLFPTALLFILLKHFPNPQSSALEGRGWGRLGTALALTAALPVLLAAAAAVLYPGEFAGKVRVLYLRLTAVTPYLLGGVKIRHMLRTIYRSFFALFGWMSHPVSGWLYLAWGLFSAGALLGWLRRSPGGISAAGKGQAGLLAAAAGLLFLGVIKNNLLVPQSQGRFLFPALGAVSVLFAGGLLRHFPERWRPPAAWILLALLAGLDLIAFSELTGLLP